MRFRYFLMPNTQLDKYPFGSLTWEYMFLKQFTLASLATVKLDTSKNHRQVATRFIKDIFLWDCELLFSIEDYNRFQALNGSVMHACLGLFQTKFICKKGFKFN